MTLKNTSAEQIHFELLTKWRKAMDLVGPGPLEPHFDDSAQAIELLKRALKSGDALKQTTWADLGSGAGFPGISLAGRVPEIQVHLVESRQRRAVFLGQVAAKISNASVKHQRTETLDDGVYMGLISRAYKGPEGVFEDARRLLLPQGVVALMRASEDVEPPEDFEMFHVEHYRLDDGRGRVLVLCRKRA